MAKRKKPENNNVSKSSVGHSGGSSKAPVSTRAPRAKRSSAGAVRGKSGPQRRLTGDQQITEMMVLTQKAAAWLLGYSAPVMLSNNLSVPRSPDGSYNARDLTKYHAEDRLRRKDRPGDRDRIGMAEAAEGGGALELKRLLEARKIQLQLLEMEKTVVPVKQVDEFFSALSARLRAFGDVLQRNYGAESVVLLNEALDDVDQTVMRWQAAVSQEDELDEFNL